MEVARALGGVLSNYGAPGKRTKNGRDVVEDKPGGPGNSISPSRLEEVAPDLSSPYLCPTTMASFKALRPTLRQVTSSLSPALAFRRCLHERVPLPYALEAGVAPFLSPSALQTVAVDWQQGVLTRLNELVRGAFGLVVVGRMGRGS